MKEKIPSLDEWIAEAKKNPDASQCGMYLAHNGIVRKTAKAKVRYHAEGTREVTGMLFSYDDDLVHNAIASAKKMPGIYYVKVWLNEGDLKIGDDIMLVLIGGDIRPHVVDALQALVSEIKNNCVSEQEIYS